MVDSVRKYGVDIEQVFTTTPPEPTVPGLIPVVVAPCMEILESTTTAGALNTNAALSSPYIQQGISAAFTALPAPRGNGSTLSFKPETIQVDLLTGNKLRRLSRTEAFLASHNKASRAAFFWKVADWSAIGGTLILAIDQHRVSSASKDVSVVIPDTVAAVEEVAALINEAVGEEVATVVSHNFAAVGTPPETYIQIASPTFGATSSVTIRRFGDNVALNLDAVNYRVVGSGINGYDDEDLDTTTPWVQFSVGSVFKDADDAITVTSTFGTDLATGVVGSELRAARILEDDTIVAAAAAAEDWSDFELFAATALKSGDVFYADGVAVGQIIKVEESRFKLGAVDTVNSTYDSNGDPIRQVYVPVEVNTMLSAAPFAPMNAWFLARSLSGEEENAASYIDSSNGTAATAAEIESDNVATVPLEAQTLILTVTEDGIMGDEEVLVWTTVYDSRADLQAGFADICAAQGVFSNIECSIVGDVLTFSTKKTGAGQSILVGAGTSNVQLGIATGDTDDGTDPVLAGLNGNGLSFKLDNNPTVFEVNFISNSMTDAVAAINEAVGAEVASIADGPKLKISSLLKGVGSAIEITASTLGAVDLGTDDPVTPGSGRPSPDVVVSTLLSTVTLNPQLIRNSVTGDPLALSAPVYFSYEALRREVAAPFTDRAVSVSNFTELSANFGPLDERNPLGLGLFFALNSAGEGTVVKGVGVGEVTATEPKGTVVAYLEALSVLRGEECYFVVPFSSSKEVIDAADVHVKDMSAVENRGERVLISCPSNPTRESDTVVLSGVNAESGEPGQLDLNDNPGDELVAAGINPSIAIPFELADTRQLYVEFTVAGEVYRYSVSRVSGSVLTLRSNIAADKNLDGFFTTGVFAESVTGVSFSLKVRGKSLFIPGTTQLDKTRYAQAVRDIAQQYANRRHLRLYPDTVTTTINGESKNVSSFYFGCSLAGSAAFEIASAPFSGRPVIGFTAVVGPRLQEAQYDIVSAGNAVIEAPVAGGNLALRMQSTTDVSSVETREWSITKSIDAFAKAVRSTLRSRTGPFLISKGYLDQTTLILSAVASTATEAGLLQYAKVESVAQDPEEKTTVGAAFVIKPYYAANYLKVTIFS
jgi:hypothetical protein